MDTMLLIVLMGIRFIRGLTVIMSFIVLMEIKSIQALLGIVLLLGLMGIRFILGVLGMMLRIGLEDRIYRFHLKPPLKIITKMDKIPLWAIL